MQKPLLFLNFRTDEFLQSDYYKKMKLSHVGYSHVLVIHRIITRNHPYFCQR